LSHSTDDTNVSRNVIRIGEIANDAEQAWGTSAQVCRVSHLVCPICGDTYNHAEPPRVLRGGVLSVRDDAAEGSGVVIPFRCENGGHEWGIGIANHKGVETIGVLLNLGRA